MVFDLCCSQMFQHVGLHVGLRELTSGFGVSCVDHILLHLGSHGGRVWPCKISLGALAGRPSCGCISVDLQGEEWYKPTKYHSSPLRSGAESFKHLGRKMAIGFAQLLTRKTGRRQNSVETSHLPRWSAACLRLREFSPQPMAKCVAGGIHLCKDGELHEINGHQHRGTLAVRFACTCGRQMTGRRPNHLGSQREGTGTHLALVPENQPFASARRHVSTVTSRHRRELVDVGGQTW